MSSVKVAFVSCVEDSIAAYLDQVRALYPELPLYVVSEFPPPSGNWIPYKPRRSFMENLARVKAAVSGKSVRISAVVLEPKRPFGAMRWMAFLLSPRGFLAFNEHLNNFMLRPRCANTIARHFYWRARGFLTFQLSPGGTWYTWVWRIFHPSHLRRPFSFELARLSGWLAALAKTAMPRRPDPAPKAELPEGITVVVPSRNGRDLLGRLLPGLLAELERFPHEVIVVDNGSSDDTPGFLASEYPQVTVEVSDAPLSFAGAVNRGIRRARHRFTCLLNNDMILEPGFFPPLCEAFDQVPDLFCATAQILFPEGTRRQETGKAVRTPLSTERTVRDFPIRCEMPYPDENLSYVLYGSGGASLFSTTKLHQLHGFDETYVPAYVEDLDLGYRGWQRNWPTVFVSPACVIHFHRSTTSRYFKPELLQSFVEFNYLRFVARRVADPKLFLQIWREAIQRLNHLAVDQPWIITWPAEALAFAWKAPLRHLAAPPFPLAGEADFLALTSGDVAVFPGRSSFGKPRILIVSSYLPYPLSHGGAVRMFNLMRGAAADYDQILVAFTDQHATPPAELSAICAEIVQVRRRGSHLLPSTGRPEVVEEFDSPTFRAAIHQTVRKWRPRIAQLEFTQMAQYARDCAPAKTILVEHDITLDLYQQLLHQRDDWETRRQHERWVRFEHQAWKEVHCVVTMSAKDQRAVTGAQRVETLTNGVDLERFQPGGADPEPRRILFLGSFNHLPNVMAVDFFLREVWPSLQDLAPTLHIIAGARHRYYLDHYKDVVQLDLTGPGIEVEDFVPDVRPAYRRAAVVIAPLIASAGTNIKIMEAMAMGKAIVSTPAGVNGLDDLESGRDLEVTTSATDMAGAIRRILEDGALRLNYERRARETVAARYGWNVVAKRQRELYESLIARP